MKYDPAAVHERLHAAEQHRRIEVLEHMLHVGDGPRRQRLRGPDERRQLATGLPHRRKLVGDGERITLQIQIVPAQDHQKSEAEPAGLALVGDLHDRYMVIAERLDEDTRRACHTYRPVAEGVAQPHRFGQPLVQEAWRTGNKPRAGFARLVINRLLDDDFRHGRHTVRTRRVGERFMNFSWAGAGEQLDRVRVERI